MIQYDIMERFSHFAPVVLLWMVAMVPILIGYQVSKTGSNNIEITEICRKTTAISTDALTREEPEDGDISYIVILNHGNLAFESNELYLSDNEEDLRYIKVDGGVIEPGESYKCIIPSDDGMNIKKKGGTTVYLSDSLGDVVSSLVVPALARDESYRKSSSGDDEWEVVSWAKDESEAEEVLEPAFSVDSGYYEEDFDLYLSAGERQTIYYTLDCSEPTVESTKYSDPIHVYDRSDEANVFRSVQNVQPDYKNKSEIGTRLVPKVFVVRAIAIDSDGRQSRSITKTYLVGLNRLKEDTVVSLVTDPKNLFDERIGIYVTGKEYDEWYSRYLSGDVILAEEQDIVKAGPTPNYSQKGRAWEREGYCEIFDASGTLLNQAVGIRIQGATSRGMPLKRFAVFSRKDYSGSRLFNSPIIDGTYMHSFVLRRGFLNAFAPSLVEDRNVCVQRGIPVHVFLDGEYWYSAFLLEKYDSTYYSEHYGIDRNNVEILESSLSDDIKKALRQEGFKDDAEEYASINEVIDIQSYIDFVCINAYVNNEDMYERRNYIVWKSIIRENAREGDTRWRWGLYDMDLNWGYSYRDHSEGDLPYQTNTFTLGMAPGKKRDFALVKQSVYKRLRRNSIFCRQFVLTFMDLVNSNFRKETVLSRLEEYENTKPEITDFFTYRADYIVPYMAEEFELKGSQQTVTLTSNVHGNPIKLNTIKPEIDSEWTGTYFTDYPVTVTANYDGFDHWEITAGGVTSTYKESTLEVPVMEGGVEINAVFK